ncbi:hypothetical protein CS345_11735 [Bordetella bronchiseptica]|uniref:Uncharacterized protein n=2 Tax=Bordetella bronchiseptica TaxID=518 RepID=A0A0H3LNB2_BORBR|nr:hypothetical protein AL472_15765 [Bordetella bronchiseptica]CAE33342.1 Hypothetical protein BB2850 [Bordetella bronchiseptica RB50]CCJ52570.1 Hypothetical protein BN112_0652 [Bordetella bronchiseptica 253]CCN23103.1 Hypothetical protein BN113_2319 [Bordetella bronchiseptica 1289]AWP75141.1 hypothetical protein B7P10_12040 [Bordetella bronchiseptica]
MIAAPERVRRPQTPCPWRPREPAGAAAPQARRLQGMRHPPLRRAIVPKRSLWPVSPPDAEPRPGLGPSDSSDSASDLPDAAAETDSDTGGTGERPGVEYDRQPPDGADIAPDTQTDAGHAGVSRHRPDSVRNGGPPDQP